MQPGGAPFPITLTAAENSQEQIVMAGDDPLILAIEDNPNVDTVLLRGQLCAAVRFPAGGGGVAFNIMNGTSMNTSENVYLYTEFIGPIPDADNSIAELPQAIPMPWICSYCSESKLMTGWLFLNGVYRAWDVPARAENGVVSLMLSIQFGIIDPDAFVRFNEWVLSPRTP